MIDDFDLIVSSFQSEYGVRIYSKDFKNMKWDEFASLLNGLSADSPLGRMVQIRLENDKNILKHFTPYQRKIRAEWHNKKAKHISKKETDIAIEQMKNVFLEIAKGGWINGK